jgi:hypothetical protein
MMKPTRIALILTSALPTLALAASSGNLPLSGTVAQVNDLLITENGTNNTSLNITGGESGKNVAAVQESSNDELGYKVSVSSLNNGQLQLASDASKQTSYQISYNGGSYVSPTSSAAVIKSVGSLGGLTVSTSQLLVNVTAYPTAVAGVYSDTLT